jgi:hypothetical protein
MECGFQSKKIDIFNKHFESHNFKTCFFCETEAQHYTEDFYSHLIGHLYDNMDLFKVYNEKVLFEYLINTNREKTSFEKDIEGLTNNKRIILDLSKVTDKGMSYAEIFMTLSITLNKNKQINTLVIRNIDTKLDKQKDPFIDFLKRIRTGFIEKMKLDFKKPNNSLMKIIINELAQFSFLEDIEIIGEVPRPEVETKETYNFKNSMLKKIKLGHNEYHFLFKELFDKNKIESFYTSLNLDKMMKKKNTSLVSLNVDDNLKRLLKKELLNNIKELSISIKLLDDEYIELSEYISNSKILEYLSIGLYDMSNTKLILEAILKNKTIKRLKIYFDMKKGFNFESFQSYFDVFFLRCESIETNINFQFDYKNKNLKELTIINYEMNDIKKLAYNETLESFTFTSVDRKVPSDEIQNYIFKYNYNLMYFTCLDQFEKIFDDKIHYNLVIRNSKIPKDIFSFYIFDLIFIYKN